MGGKLKQCLLGVAILAGLVTVGCSQGSYPVDIFYEMHYQQSYKSHEPPRLSAPDGSVAWFPPPKSTAFTTGRHLYTINCSMCHGAGGQGDGAVVQKLKETYGYKPVIDPPVITDNPVENIVLILSSETRFFGPDSVMPPFGKLLSAEERLTIAQYVQSLASVLPATSDGQELAPTPLPPAAPVAPAEGETLGPLVISVDGDLLEFDRAAFEIAASTEVVLAFNNFSAINQHNFVIVQAGQKDVVSARGAVAGPANDWIQPGDPEVIAHTALLNPGETGELKFSAPPAGSYQFVCTFPGHNATMFGDFVVKP